MSAPVDIVEVIEEEFFNEYGEIQVGSFNYVKKSGVHCYHERMRFFSATNMDKAKQLCSKFKECGGIYDPGCDSGSNGRLYLCQKGFSPGTSEASCIYEKSGSGGNSRGGGDNRNNNNNNNRNNRNNNNRNSGGGKCLAKGSCSNTVEKCGHCVFGSQCEGNMYCCPYMKKCVENGSTPCFTPIADCIPPCRESSGGYPGSCKCDNKKFPNTWMTSGTEEALADVEEYGEVHVGNSAEIQHKTGAGHLVKSVFIFIFGILFAVIVKMVQEEDYCSIKKRGDKFESLITEEI